MKFLSFLADIDSARLRVTTRTAIAACIALGLGTLIGLDHPQWAAMTVWITALPTRGQRLERSIARVAGTLFGALAGVALMAMVGNSPLGIVFGLTIWLGLCAGTGNFLTGSASYVCLLAGYSAAMVALLGYGHGEPLWLLAIDRIATICLGGFVGTVIARIFSSPSPQQDLTARLNDLVHACLDHMLSPSPDKAERLRLISDISAIDENLDMNSAGSIRARREAREVKTLLSALTHLLLDRRKLGDGSQSHSALAKSFSFGDRITDIKKRLICISGEFESELPEYSKQLQALIPLIHRANSTVDTIVSAANSHLSLQLHRDWIGARRAALRSIGAVAATGLLWIVTAWPLGPYMVMGAAIMTSVFSTFPNPSLQMRWVIGGSLLGALAAIIAHTCILPLTNGAGTAALLTMPLMLLGAPVMAHRRIGLAGMEYNLIYLLMMNPNQPVDPLLSHALLQATAVILGPISAFIAFLAIPVDMERRLNFIIRLMVSELAAMAKGAYDDPKRSKHWRMRIYHRLMLLVRLGERNGTNREFTTNGALSAFELGETLQTLRGMTTKEGLGHHAQRSLKAALISITYLPHTPERVEKAFRQAAKRLENSHPGEAVHLSDTAARIAKNRDFFTRAA